MMHAMRVLLAVFVLLTLVMGPPATIATEGAGTLRDRPEVPILACDPDAQQASGAWYRICMPALWNGDLLVYAHGYVSPLEPVGIPEDQMVIPGTTISVADIANFLGYAFATTSYSTNGLAVRQGLADLVDLVDLFAAAKGAPNRILLVGVSEGGLITTLALEQYPTVFDGGLALCGPYGDFSYQIDYFGDHRVLFDYFFPSLLPPTPVSVPEEFLPQWSNYYTTTVQPVLQDPANSHLVDQLLATARAPCDPADPNTREETISDLLRYNILATNDAGQKLGGQPFDNVEQVYAGSDDDDTLNLAVQRFAAEQAALDELSAHYQTSGQLSVPLVTLHTTADPIVPYEHALMYRAKTFRADNIALHEHRSAERYGHCNFTSTEVLDAFNRLVEMVNNPPLYLPVQRAYLPLVERSR